MVVEYTGAIDSKSSQEGFLFYRNPLPFLTIIHIEKSNNMLPVMLVGSKC